MSESARPVATLPRRLRSHVETLCAFDPPRCWGSPGLAAAGTWVRESMHAATGHSRVQAYDVVIGGRREKVWNVVARIGDGPGPLRVIGAHYDAVAGTPGADDNASAVAVLLELARLLAAAPRTAGGAVELVAFTLEEPPAFSTSDMGSAIHAAHLRRSRTPVEGMISLEMVGFFDSSPGSQALPSGVAALLPDAPEVGDFYRRLGRLADHPRQCGPGATLKIAGEGPTSGLSSAGRLGDRREIGVELHAVSTGQHTQSRQLRKCTILDAPHVAGGDSGQRLLGQTLRLPDGSHPIAEPRVLPNASQVRSRTPHRIDEVAQRSEVQVNVSNRPVKVAAVRTDRHPSKLLGGQPGQGRQLADRYVQPLEATRQHKEHAAGHRRFGDQLVLRSLFPGVEQPPRQGRPLVHEDVPPGKQSCPVEHRSEKAGADVSPDQEPP